jgi:hypothetical protein
VWRAVDLVTSRPPFPLPTAGRKFAYWLAIPVAALGLYGLFAVLWHAGAHSAYFGALRLFGVNPYSFPFLDIDAVLAAGECSRHGVDVYAWNPCDPLGRPHVYSPLWLALIPGFLGKWASGWVGLSLDLAFIVSWGILLRPRSWQAVLIFGLAALSPMTVYALERANNDLVVFLLIVCGGLLFTTNRPYRLCSYALYFVAGLLKYYPLVLLIHLARERRRDAVAAVSAIGFLLILFGAYFHSELSKALGNIPAASYFTDSFSAENLPFGMAQALGDCTGIRLISFSLLGALLAVTMARMGRTLRLLEREHLDYDNTEVQWLATGAMLVTACFFAGQNINYRGIYFLLVMPGLVRVGGLAGETTIRRFYGRMVAAVLFVMWEEFFRRVVHSIVDGGTGQGVGSRAEVFFWVGRELVWWWLVAGLAAIVWSYLRQLPLLRDSISTLRTGVSRSWFR